MTFNERASLMRIVSDMIRADAIIDTREIEHLHFLRSKYNLRQEEDANSAKISLAQAVYSIQQSKGICTKEILTDLYDVAMSDSCCAREEALLYYSLHETFLQEKAANVISFEVKDDINIDDAQILYVESSYDEDINKQIIRYFREISAELKLSGFDFVYMPHISEHYRSLPKDKLENIIAFLYPATSSEHISKVADKMLNLDTAEFCRDQLINKLGAEGLTDTPPALFIKIGNDIVQSKQYANFLLVEILDDILTEVRRITDAFSKLYRTRVLNYIEEDKGRFVYTGFYKQVIDMHILRRGIRSSVVVDATLGEILLPEAGAKIPGLHRREKALYTLFLMESASGGINFTFPPEGQIRTRERFMKRMQTVQHKYEMIYHAFGGDPLKAPKLIDHKTRLPMLATIKKQIRELGDIILNNDAYLVQRNMYGNYCVGIPEDLCLCYDIEKQRNVQFKESVFWSKIHAI